MTLLDPADSIHTFYYLLVENICIKSFNERSCTSKAFKTKLIKIGRDRFPPTPLFLRSAIVSDSQGMD